MTSSQGDFIELLILLERHTAGITFSSNSGTTHSFTENICNGDILWNILSPILALFKCAGFDDPLTLRNLQNLLLILRKHSLHCRWVPYGTFMNVTRCFITC